MKILILNGPNMNMLGIREPGIYGKQTYADLVTMLEEHARERNVEVYCVQTNHEGTLVDEIHKAYFDGVKGIVFNPAAYTHTSVAIADALKAVGIPTVEVHVSNVDEREEFRKVSTIRNVVVHAVIGEGLPGYIHAMDYLIDRETAT